MTLTPKRRHLQVRRFSLAQMPTTFVPLPPGGVGQPIGLLVILTKAS